MMRTRRAVHLWEWAAEGAGTSFALDLAQSASWSRLARNPGR